MEHTAMRANEATLKQLIKDGPQGLFVLYGEEGYLSEQYARMIARKVVDEAFDAFNLQQFDGQSVTLEQLEEAVEALPLMAEQKCVQVRDFDAGVADADRLAALIANLPETCVLVFRQMTVQPDKKKGWQSFLKQAEQVGTVVCFDRLTAADAAKMLVGGAKRRGCVLTPDNARYLVEMAGSDLQLLLGELDKLAALADGGEITREQIDRAATKNLEARVFDLSKAILARRAGQAYELLHQLQIGREDPIAVLAVLSNAYADLYRGKIAQAGGVTADELAADFKTYKGKEFRLRNAMRDASRMSVDTLRACIDVLADADTALKTGRTDGFVLLEQTVARLIDCADREGRL